MQSRTSSVFTRKSSQAGVFAHEAREAQAAAAARDASIGIGGRGGVGGMPSQTPATGRSNSDRGASQPRAPDNAYLRSPAASSRKMPTELAEAPLAADPYKTTSAANAPRSSQIASIQLKVADLFASGIARCMLRNANMTDDVVFPDEADGHTTPASAVGAGLAPGGNATPSYHPGGGVTPSYAPGAITPSYAPGRATPSYTAGGKTPSYAPAAAAAAAASSRVGSPVLEVPPIGIGPTSPSYAPPVPQDVPAQPPTSPRVSHAKVPIGFAIPSSKPKGKGATSSGYSYHPAPSSPAPSSFRTPTKPGTLTVPYVHTTPNCDPAGIAQSPSSATSARSVSSFPTEASASLSFTSPSTVPKAAPVVGLPQPSYLAGGSYAPSSPTFSRGSSLSRRQLTADFNGTLEKSDVSVAAGANAAQASSSAPDTIRSLHISLDSEPVLQTSPNMEPQEYPPTSSSPPILSALGNSERQTVIPGSIGSRGGYAAASRPALPATRVPPLAPSMPPTRTGSGVNTPAKPAYVPQRPAYVPSVPTTMKAKDTPAKSGGERVGSQASELLTKRGKSSSPRSAGLTVTPRPPSLTRARSSSGLRLQIPLPGGSSGHKASQFPKPNAVTTPIVGGPQAGAGTPAAAGALPVGAQTPVVPLDPGGPRIRQTPAGVIDEHVREREAFLGIKPNMILSGIVCSVDDAGIGMRIHKVFDPAFVSTNEKDHGKRDYIMDIAELKVDGFCDVTELGALRGPNFTSEFKIEQPLKAIVLSVDHHRERIHLSFDSARCAKQKIEQMLGIVYGADYTSRARRSSQPEQVDSGGLGHEPEKAPAKASWVDSIRASYMFRNPRGMRFMCKAYETEEYGSCFFVDPPPRDEMYYTLLKNQNHKWAEATAEKAVLQIKEKNFPLAIQLMSQAMEIEPDNNEVVTLRGIAYHNLGDTQTGERAARNFELAIKDFDVALKLNPEQRNAEEGRNKALTKLGRSDEITWNCSKRRIRAEGDDTDDDSMDDEDDDEDDGGRDHDRDRYGDEGDHSDASSDSNQEFGPQPPMSSSSGNSRRRSDEYRRGDFGSSASPRANAGMRDDDHSPSAAADRGMRASSSSRSQHRGGGADFSVPVGTRRSSRGSSQHTSPPHSYTPNSPENDDFARVPSFHRSSSSVSAASSASDGSSATSMSTSSSDVGSIRTEDVLKLYQRVKRKRKRKELDDDDDDHRSQKKRKRSKSKKSKKKSKKDKKKKSKSRKKKRKRKRSSVRGYSDSESESDSDSRYKRKKTKKSKRKKRHRDRSSSRSRSASRRSRSRSRSPRRSASRSRRERSYSYVSSSRRRSRSRSSYATQYRSRSRSNRSYSPSRFRSRSRSNYRDDSMADVPQEAGDYPPEEYAHTSTVNQTEPTPQPVQPLPPAPTLQRSLSCSSSSSSGSSVSSSTSDDLPMTSSTIPPRSTNLPPPTSSSSSSTLLPPLPAAPSSSSSSTPRRPAIQLYRPPSSRKKVSSADNNGESKEKSHRPEKAEQESEKTQEERKRERARQFFRKKYRVGSGSSSTSSTAAGAAAPGARREGAAENGTRESQNGSSSKGGGSGPGAAAATSESSSSFHGGRHQATSHSHDEESVGR